MPPIRLLSVFTAACAIALGALAAHQPQPLAEACDIVPGAISGTGTFQVNCTGLNMFANYRIVTNGDSVLSAPDLGTGDGSSAANARGLAGTGSGPLSFNLASSKTLYFNTATKDVTDAAMHVTLQKLSGGVWVDVTNSDDVPVYYLTFIGTNTVVVGGAPTRVSIQGFVGSESVTLQPANSGTDAADGTGWSLGSSGIGTVFDPYQFSTTTPYPRTVNADSGSIDLYMKTTTVMSSVMTSIKLVVNGTVLVWRIYIIIG